MEDATLKKPEKDEEVKMAEALETGQAIVEATLWGRNAPREADVVSPSAKKDQEPFHGHSALRKRLIRNATLSIFYGDNLPHGKTGLLVKMR